MNTIPINQNADSQLQKLAAQRQLYYFAKKIFFWQTIIGGPIAILAALFVIIVPDIKGLVALWGILVSLSDIFWLTPWLKKIRKNAALVQESFDCDVLKISWNDVKAGRRVDPELIFKYAEKYKQNKNEGMGLLKDWYPVGVGILPLHLARLICQRANCWWDSSQRKLYALLILISMALIFLIVLFLAWTSTITVGDFVLKVGAPLSPALIIACRQFGEQTEAANRLDRLKDHIGRLWGQALDGVPESEITAASRVLQDEILEHRKQSALIFDWIFKMLRRDYEEQMNHAAESMIREAAGRLAQV